VLTDRHVRDRLDALVKPAGSLGRLDDLAAWLCLIQQTLAPRTTPRRVVLFAAKQGIVAVGVSESSKSLARGKQTTRSGLAGRG
jgi:nicotinate-nucleotide--dimethylbenzimidazole phosphoribosyltransferase